MIDKINRIKKFRLLEKHKHILFNFILGLKLKKHTSVYRDKILFSRNGDTLFIRENNKIKYNENSLPVDSYLLSYDLDKESMEILLEDILK